MAAPDTLTCRKYALVNCSTLNLDQNRHRSLLRLVPWDPSVDVNALRRAVGTTVEVKCFDTAVIDQCGDHPGVQGSAWSIDELHGVLGGLVIHTGGSLPYKLDVGLDCDVRTPDGVEARRVDRDRAGVAGERVPGVACTAGGVGLREAVGDRRGDVAGAVGEIPSGVARGAVCAGLHGAVGDRLHNLEAIVDRADGLEE